MTNKLLAALAALVLFGACQKKDDTAPDAAKVVTNITSPQAGQLFHNGDTVHIQATITYPSELHGYEVQIVDTATGLTVYDDDQHIHSDQIVIDDKWVGTATKPTGMKLTIITEIDHDGNEARKELDFRVSP